MAEIGDVHNAEGRRFGAGPSMTGLPIAGKMTVMALKERQVVLPRNVPAGQLPKLPNG